MDEQTKERTNSSTEHGRSRMNSNSRHSPARSMSDSGVSATSANQSRIGRMELQRAVDRGRRVRFDPTRHVRRVDGVGVRVPVPLQKLHVEHYELISDDSGGDDQGWVPFRVTSPCDTSSKTGGGEGKKPVVIMLHPTGQSRDYHALWEASFVQKGYVSVAVDARYHGLRVDPQLPYQQALVKAWKTGMEHPFLLDNVWDIQRILDYLCTSIEYVDSERIGVTGMSLGGMHAWLLAAADERVGLCAPVCGVQNFGYAIDREVYHERILSIPDVFRQATLDMGGSLENFPFGVDREVVTAVWNRLLPDMLKGYDAEMSLRVIAPRPLLIVSGKKDMRCPEEGIRLALPKNCQSI